MNPATHYVCGFAFDRNFSRVALIRKEKPDWQRGLLNGIGGKIEEGELAASAMVREFKEEAGATTYAHSWFEVCQMGGANNDGGGFSIVFYAASLPLEALRSVESEKIEVVKVSDVPSLLPQMLGNVPWLLFLALDVLRGNYPPHRVVASYFPKESEVPA